MTLNNWESFFLRLVFNNKGLCGRIIIIGGRDE